MSSINRVFTSTGRTCLSFILKYCLLYQYQTPPPLSFLFSLCSIEQSSIWNWQEEKESSSFVSVRTNNTSIVLLHNSFSWSNVLRKEFIFKAPIMKFRDFFCFIWFRWRKKNRKGTFTDINLITQTVLLG